MPRIDLVEVLIMWGVVVLSSTLGIAITCLVYYGINGTFP